MTAETVVALFQSSIIGVLIGLVLALLIQRDFSVRLAVPEGVGIQIRPQPGRWHYKELNGIVRGEVWKYIKPFYADGWSYQLHYDRDGTVSVVMSKFFAD